MESAENSESCISENQGLLRYCGIQNQTNVRPQSFYKYTY